MLFTTSGTIFVGHAPVAEAAVLARPFTSRLSWLLVRSAPAVSGRQKWRKGAPEHFQRGGVREAGGETAALLGE